MITLLSALLGFFGAMTPDILGLLRDRADRRHELAILALQIKQQEAGHSQRLEEIRIAAQAKEMTAIYKTYHSGVRWVDALNATVRPVLAYAFFLLYAGVKWHQFMLIDGSLPWAVPSLWQEEDQAIFAGIISFYFGQRSFAKAKK